MRLEQGTHTFRVDGYLTLYVDNGFTSLHWDNVFQVERTQMTLPKSKRYECTCPAGIMEDDKARFAQQITLQLHDNSLDKARRFKEGLSPMVCIDPCIVEAIQKLWEQGIETQGCCCGHGVLRGFVNVHEKDYCRMFQLGYEQRPVEVVGGSVMGLYTFYL